VKQDDELHRSDELVRSETELCRSAAGLEVTDDASYREALQWIERGKRLLDDINAHHDPIIKAAYDTHKIALAAKKKFTGRIDAIIGALKRKTVAYHEAERRRIDAERREAEDRARKEAEARRLQEAEELASLGMTEAAGAALDAPPDIRPSAPPRSAEPERASGVSYRENWKAEVADLAALVKAVAEGTMPVTCLKPDMTELNRLAKVFRNTRQIPGVRQYAETVQSVRRGYD
jgi:hypothetical protein